MDYGSTLKKTIANPNRRSAHYTKQSKFEGSDREIRGMLLKKLLLATAFDEDALIRQIGAEPARVKRIIGGLIDEGFITSGSDTIHICR